MATAFTTYIDESGDLGVGVGTKWFVLTAVMVRKDDEMRVRAKISKIRSELNINEIHFRKLFDFYKKAYVVAELAGEAFTFANIIIDTSKIDKEKLPDPANVYNFACKILLERVAWFMRNNNGTTDIILSARGTSRDKELISYITTKILPYPDNKIDEQFFGKVTAKHSAEWDLLQLADVCATSTFMAYERHPRWGFTTPCHAIRLRPHLYTANGKIVSYGIKYLYAEMKEEVNGLRRLCPCEYKK